MTLSVQQTARAIEALATMFSGEAGRIVWSTEPDCAATITAEGKIVLPAPTGCHPSEFRLLAGMMLHSINRVSHSDTAAIDAANPIAAAFAGAIESARIQKASVTEFPGAALLYSDSAKVLADLGAVTQVAQSPVQAAAMQLWADAQRAVFPHEGGELVARQFEAAAGDCLDGQTRTAVKIHAAMASNSTSTGDVLRIAHELQTMFSQPPEPPQEAPGGEQGKQDQGNSAGNGSPSEAGGQQRNDDSGDASSREPSEVQQPSSESDDNPDPQDSGRGEGDAAETGEDEGDSADESGPAEGEGRQQPGTQGAGEGAKEPSGSQSPPTRNDSSQESSSSSGQGEQSNERAEDGPPQGSESDLVGDALNMAKMLSDALARTRGFEASKPAAPPELSLSSPSEAELAAQTDDAQVMATLLSSELADSDDLQTLVAAVLEQVDAQAESLEEDCPDGDAASLALSLSAPPHRAYAAVLPALQGRLIQTFLRELQQARPKPRGAAMAGARVDARKAWRLKACGDTRIFRKQALRVGVSTAVSIMLDRSDSMAHRMDVAIAATFALAQALQRISGVAVSVDVFPWRAKLTHTLLPFGKTVRSCADNFSGVSADGGTPMGAALLTDVMPQLHQRKELKKLVLVVTDGRAGDQQLVDMAKALAVRQNITLIGVGIGVDVSDQFKACVSVSDASDLPGAFEALFKSDIAQLMAA